VAAFNGGFVMNVAKGGYYTEGRVVDPLRTGAASFVIYANGSVNVGAGQRLVDDLTCRECASELGATRGRRAPHRGARANWHAWGSTCGVYSCAKSVPASIINGDRVSALRPTER